MLVLLRVGVEALECLRGRDPRPPHAPRIPLFPFPFPLMLCSLVNLAGFLPDGGGVSVTDEYDGCELEADP